MLAAVEQAVTRRMWGQQEELLATLIEAVDHVRWSVQVAAAKEEFRNRIPKPAQIDRPDSVPRRKRTWMELALEMTGRRRR